MWNILWYLRYFDSIILLTAGNGVWWLGINTFSSDWFFNFTKLSLSQTGIVIKNPNFPEELSKNSKSLSVVLFMIKESKGGFTEYIPSKGLKLKKEPLLPKWVSISPKMLQ